MSKSSTGTRNKPHRRYVTLSLWTLFALLTALAVWLGVIVNRAREQREAVKAIEALGGVVFYDWQPKLTTRSKGEWSSQRGRWKFTVASDRATPDAPTWLVQLIGDDFFQDVHGVAFIGVSTVKSHFVEEGIRSWIPSLKRLRTLKTLIIEGEVSAELMAELKAALPQCEVIQCDYYTFPKG